MKKPASALLLIILLIVFAILLAPRVVQVQSLKVRSENLEIELKKIKQENQRLETELRLLREDPLYLEKVAREKFNKAKQGEIVYRVVREREKTQTQ